MAVLTVNAPDGIDGNGFSFAALHDIDFVNGQLLSSNQDERVFQFDDGLTVALRGSDLDAGHPPTEIVVYQDGDPLVTVEGLVELYIDIYDWILNGRVADVMAGFMSTVDPWGGSNTQYGSQQGDSLNGNDGDDTLNGGGGADVLHGGGDRWDPWYGNFIEGRDTLNGGGGDDILLMPTNGDTVTGGDGADRFVILNGMWLGPGITTSTITDFSSTQGDQIDLSPLDDGITSIFIGTAAFTGTPGEVRYDPTWDGAWVFFDYDGDAYEDGWFILTGVTTLQASDFIL